MFRRITTSLLTLGLLGCAVLSGLTSAHAQGWTVAKPAETAKKRPLPTVEAIEAQLERGELLDAETDYLAWAKAWEEDDMALFVRIVTTLLQKRFQDGDASAFIALVRAGEPGALQQLREETVKLSRDEKVAAIRALGVYGSPEDLAFLTALLQHADPALVGAAIRTIGEIGDSRSLDALYLCARSANLQNSILIAKAMVQMGAVRQLRERYTPQLTNFFPTVSERAALMLAAGGDPKGWPFTKSILDSKASKQYYPLALGIIGSLPTDDTQAYVVTGLKGSEAEQLAALESIYALPEDKIDAILTAMVLKAPPAGNDAAPATLNTSLPKSVRLAALEQLADRYTSESGDVLRSIALMISGDADMIAAAILALERCGMLADNDLRATLRLQMRNDNARIALAARTALLAHALHRGQ